MTDESTNNSEEDYELMPHQEIEELKEELAKLKEFEITPTKKLRISLVELNSKIDKLLDIFEEANRQIQIEEGGMTFNEKMKPLIDKMHKILEQNSQIAEGIVTMADMVKEMKQALQEKGILETDTFPRMPRREEDTGIGMMGPMPGTRMPPPPRPPLMPEMPRKKRTFGII